MMYSAILGAIDPPRDDIICFGEDPRFTAKLFKFFPHLFSKEDTVWMDGNIFPKAPEGEIISKMLADRDMGIFAHPVRQNVYQEALEVAKLGKESQWKIDEFIEHFGKSFLERLPLYECGILVRRNNEVCRRFNMDWWNLMTKWSIRDQLTCPIAIASSGVTVNVIGYNLREHRLFRYEQHKSSLPVANE